MACEALRDFRVRGKLVTVCRVTLTMVGCHGTGTLPAAMQAIADAFEGAQFECSMRLVSRPSNSLTVLLHCLKRFLESRSNR
jgi:3-oxoadipate enol-lactonase